MTEPAISVQQVTVSVDGHRILHDISLNIDTGEFVAILGANGAGKSTLIHTIAGLIEPAEGNVLIEGIATSKRHDVSALALVPQHLPQGQAIPVSVGELVAAGRVGAKPRPWPSSTDRRAVSAALSAVSLQDRRRERLDTLSGGQQRRALIARALASGARIIALDEPTAGIDATSQQQLAEVLAKLRADGTTVLLITHELGPLAELVNRTVVLSDGKVSYDGPTPPAQFLHDHVHHHDPEPDVPGFGQVMEA